MRGGDTRALRAYNERLIIAAIRQHGPLSKAELARATGLSAQAAAMIVNALVEEGLVHKQAKVRGQIGQPHTPIALAPGGAFALGVKIGRRSVEAVCVDLAGRVVASAETVYAAPLPAVVMPAAGEVLERVMPAASSPARRRIVGLGVAMPSDLPAWSTELGLGAGDLDGWRTIDVPAALAALVGTAGELVNDATAACAAELALGETMGGASALYLYLGTFVGGGLVLDGRLYRGARGNAGAVGSMPMATQDADGRPRQLLHDASVFVVEDRLRARGRDPAVLTANTVPAAADEAVLAPWVAAAGTALARAAIATASVVDIDTVVVDGLVAPALLDRVASALDAAIPGFNTKGIAPLTVRRGAVGKRARVLGAALLPLNARFSPDPDVLVGAPRERTGAAGPDERLAAS